MRSDIERGFARMTVDLILGAVRRGRCQLDNAAAATVERVAKRLHWDPPANLVKLVHDAAAETNKAKQVELWRQYQQAMIDEAHIFVLFQPIYQISIRKTIKQIGLTAAGWQVDMYDVKPT